MPINDPFKSSGSSGGIVDPFKPAPSGVSAEQQGFPYDKPGTDYGNVLPLARDTKTGALSLAVPEMIRSPIRGAIDRGKDIMGRGKPVGSTVTTPDDLAAVAALGGARPAPGMPVGATLPPSRIVPAHVTQAREAGYVLPPAMTGKPGQITSALSAWGGKTKLQQAASVKNQETTNQLAARALGLSKDTTLTPKILEDVRDKAGKAYSDVESVVPMFFPDEKFFETGKALGGSSSQAAQYFPGLMSNPGVKAMVSELGGVKYFTPRAGLELVKELRFSGNANLKALGDPMKHSLGLAQRQAADAIEDLMDRQIQETASAQVGGPNAKIIDRYREARRQIAKSYDIEGAMNPATGDVNALGIARLAAKGRPLTGELDSIAQAAAAFPRAMQPVTRFGGEENHSAVDFFGSALAIAHGNPSIAGALMGRPLVRGVVLGKALQNRAATQPGPRQAILPSPQNIGAKMVPGVIAGQNNQ